MASDSSISYGDQKEFADWNPPDYDSMCCSRKRDYERKKESEASETTTVDFKPYITLQCKECSQHIDVRALHEHKKYHEALVTLKYKQGMMPESVDSLMDRRLLLLKKISNGNDLIDQKLIRQIDKAYELVRSHMDQTYEPFRQVRDDVDVNVKANSLNCSNLNILAVSWCCHKNERWKEQMEDTKVFQDSFGNDPRKAYFAVFDGYGGHRAAHVAATELHHFLLHEMIKFDSSIRCTCTINKASSAYIKKDHMEDHKSHCRPISSYSEKAKLHEISQDIVQQIIESSTKKLQLEDINERAQNLTNKSLNDNKDDMYNSRISDCFKKAHFQTDLLLSLGKEENSKVRWSGCSTVTILVDSLDRPRPVNESSSSDINRVEQIGYMHIANCGDSEAMLVRANRPYMLTKKHSTKNPAEVARVTKQGGKLSSSKDQKCVNGVLPTTRGLGNHGDPDLRKFVIRKPSTITVKLDNFSQFVVIASKGVWDVFTPDEVATLLLQILPSNRLPPTIHCTSSVRALVEQNSVILSAVQSRISYDLNKPLSKQSIEDDNKSENSSDVFSNFTRSTLSDSSSESDESHATIMLGEDTWSESSQTVEENRQRVQRGFANAMAEKLTQAAILAGTRHNVTVMIFLLPASGL
ncbi:DgyrCDS11136 [Dimorphilus gyrociliatus]|uniref:DgyrCDS11136 n=1 Tax=Dimorphilus gyrociliatus TaxID=2664684 RepID=A0A7I8W3F2_9ANNE|nr:DgyrCDS11136 [Dimorphilus gyrociliatus]